MRLPTVLATTAVALAALLLTGCVATPSGAPSTTSARETPTPSATPAIATGLLVSLDQVSATMSDGSTGDSAPFTDGAAVLAFLSKQLGSTPTPTVDDAYGFTGYDWGGLSLALRSDDNSYASVAIRVDHIGSLTLSTPEGIRVGSTVAEVEKVASPGTKYAPDSSNAYFGLEARPHPGVESLTFPGQVGKDYIDVDLTDGVVFAIASPGGDWQDL